MESENAIILKERIFLFILDITNQFRKGVSND